MKVMAVAVLAAAIGTGCAAVAVAQDGPYQVTKIQLVGGDGGFDYVTADSDARNLYVARSGPQGHIGVFNLDTLAQVGDIPGTSAHGGAVDTATGHGFATSKPVTMFDGKTFAILKKIDVAGNPDGYLNDAYNHRFYVLSHSAPNITVLDDKDGSILGTIDIGGAPEQAATDGHGRIYVDIEDKAAIAVIDADKMTMVGKYDLSSRGSGLRGTGARCEERDSFFGVPRQEEYGDFVGGRWAHHYRSADWRGMRWGDVQSGDDGGVQFAGRWDADGDQGKFTDGFCCGADGGDSSAREDADTGYEDGQSAADHGRVWADADGDSCLRRWRCRVVRARRCLPSCADQERR